MAPPTNFDLLQCPLRGANLIEASAGTGKTYTIAALFLRLLLEGGLEVGQILVVTFTEAATAELRQRIRSRLTAALQGCRRGRADDPVLEALLHRFPDRNLAHHRLRRALFDFDQAAIHTIHGFCLKILREYGFVAGTGFDAALLPDQQQLYSEVVADFWRLHFASASPGFVHHARHNQATPEKYLSLLRLAVNHPRLRITPEVAPADYAALEKEACRQLNQLGTAWRRCRQEVERLLLEHPGLNRRRYPPAKVPAWIAAADALFASVAHGPTTWTWVEKFSATTLAAVTKKAATPPDHPFFHQCDQLLTTCRRLQALYDQHLLFLQHELCRWGTAELRRRKQRRNVQGFDDLLTLLHQALTGECGGDLAAAIRRDYRAALVDEFQDTDPLQWEIFRQLFGGADTVLFVIGDPKQAIYGFRGADVFAYLQAATAAAHTYSLAENYRSDPRLVAGINTLFSRLPKPFVIDEIDFHPVAAAKDSRIEPLCLDGSRRPPLQIWLLDDDGAAPGAPALSKQAAGEIIPGAVAAEISRLLHLAREGRALVGKVPLRAQDIAVLVRTNAQAAAIQEALKEVGVPAVLFTTESLFATHEAAEMSKLLAAVVEPGRRDRLLTALATDFLGLGGAELERLAAGGGDLDRWLLSFGRYHQLWRQRGFIFMLRSLIEEQEVLPRLAACPDGERRCTNVLHLAEVLHHASRERHLGLTGLLAWLQQQIMATDRWSDEHQLRLESDAAAVRVVTIHRSKGLEYPVVFCPYLWEGVSLQRRGRPPFLYHDPEAANQATLALAGEPQSDALHRWAEEQLAENLRLMYVALTRARNRLYLFWGRLRGAETSAPALLFHPPPAAAGSGGPLIHLLQAHFAQLTTADLRRDLEALQAAAPEAIEIGPVPAASFGAPPPAPAASVPEARQFSGRIATDWQVSSFSALVSGKLERAEMADYDDLAAALPSPALEEAVPLEPTGILAFPKGARAGIFFHDLLEHLDFASGTGEDAAKLAAAKLQQHGFDAAWRPVIMEMLERLLQVPLLPEIGLCLGQVPRERRLDELEFYFPVKRLTPSKLAAVLAAHQLPPAYASEAGRLTFNPFRGLLKGFIDLVFCHQKRFYLLDWKSNFLGPQLEDYHQGHLETTMQAELYFLQYHLYTLALHQYLQLRLPAYDYDRSFGGVFYVFIRGLHPDGHPEYGIYRCRPSKELIESLAAALIDSEVGA